MRFWTQWMRAPQQLWLRRAIFQIHLWSGIGLGVYMFVICLTGSVLVYRNELYTVFSPQLLAVGNKSGFLTQWSGEGARS